MEHIVQFGITIDDDAIKNHIINKATGEIVSAMKNDIMKAVGKEMKHGDNYKVNYESKIKELVNETVEKFLVDNKEDIIEKTAEKITDRLSRTKAVKDILADTICNIMNGDK